MIGWCDGVGGGGDVGFRVGNMTFGMRRVY